MEKCILLYEDDQEIQGLCKRLLTKSGYRVEAMSACQNVINDIAAFQPDLILMDLWIPEIGGEKAVTLIKQNHDTKHIPVLLFSANAGIKEICERVSANGFIEKPFDLIAFKATIEKHIS